MEKTITIPTVRFYVLKTMGGEGGRGGSKVLKSFEIRKSLSMCLDRWATVGIVGDAWGKDGKTVLEGGGEGAFNRNGERQDDGKLVS